MRSRHWRRRREPGADRVAASYLFFKPRTLPVDPSTMDGDSVIEWSAAEAGAALERVFPGIQRTPDGEWRADTAAGWAEFRHADTPPPAILVMRCSLRADYRAVVRGMCDATGWIAFGDDAACIQPVRPPTAGNP